MRLLTGLILPEQEPENRKALGRGEYRKLLAEEPWRKTCDWPAPCSCVTCINAKPPLPIRLKMKPLDK